MTTRDTLNYLKAFATEAIQYADNPTKPPPSLDKLASPKSWPKHETDSTTMALYTSFRIIQILTQEKEHTAALKLSAIIMASLSAAIKDQLNAS